MKKTLQHRIDDLDELYGERNAMFLRNGEERLAFLLDATRSFGKLIRRDEKNSLLLTKGLASIFSRTCTFASSFRKLPIVECLSMKYPIGLCAYCQKAVCECGERRTTELQIATVNEHQLPWTVTDWCNNLDRAYGKNNRDRGIAYALSRLSEEIGEVTGTLLIEAQDRELALSEIRHKIACEFADIFAWTFSISAMLEIDLDSMLELRYAGTCYRCKKRPCDCGRFEPNKKQAFTNPGDQPVADSVPYTNS